MSRLWTPLHPWSWHRGTGPPVLSGESHTCQNIVTVTVTSLAMADIKFTYFDLRVKGEAARILLAYGGLP